MTDPRQTADPEICAHWDWCPYCKNGLDTGLQCDHCLADLMPVQEALRELQRLRSSAGASGCGHVPAGYSCVTPGCSNGPAPEPEDLRAEVERLRVERYLCVLAMRCAMGAHHDGVDAMRERLEPVVARYGIATACAARAAISDADAACIEAQYSRSEIAGSSGEPRDECRCIPMAPRPWNFCTDCGGRIPETKGEKP